MPAARVERRPEGGASNFRKVFGLEDDQLKVPESPRRTAVKLGRPVSASSPLQLIGDPAGTLSRSARPFKVPLLATDKIEQNHRSGKPPLPQTARERTADAADNADLRRTASARSPATRPVSILHTTRPSSGRVSRRPAFVPATGSGRSSRGGQSPLVNRSGGSRAATAQSDGSLGNRVPGSRAMDPDEEADALRKTLLNRLNISYLKAQKAFLNMDKDRDGVVSGNDLRLAMKEMNVGVPRAVVPLLLQKCGADPDVGMDFAAYAETQREHAKIVPSPDFAREPLWTPDEYFRNKWAKAPQPALTPPRTPAVLEPGFRQMPGWPLMSEFTPAQHAPLSSRKSDAERARLRASVEERFRERVPIELEHHKAMMEEKRLVHIAKHDGIAERRAAAEAERQATIRKMRESMEEPISRPPADKELRAGNTDPGLRNWALRDNFAAATSWRR